MQSGPITTRQRRLSTWRWHAERAAVTTVLLLMLLGSPGGARAQGSCGAAGGPPAGPAFSVCDFAREAAGLPAPGPALGAGNPVDLATGNKYRHELDLRVDGPIPLVLARHYNSRNRHDGPLGVGWSHSFETRLVHLTRGRRNEVQLIQGDGRRLVFDATGGASGSWRSGSIEHGLITRQGHGAQARWRWRWPGGRSLEFDATGRLSSISRDGHGLLHLGRDDSGRLTHLSGPGRWLLEFQYIVHPQGPRLDRVIGAHGHTIARYTYDDTGQLASVTWPDGRGHRFDYADPSDPLLLTAVHRLDPNRSQSPIVIARITYDLQGRAVRTVDALASESLQIDYLERQEGMTSGLTAVTDEQGTRAHYRWHYDRHRHEARLIEASGTPCARCPIAPRRYHWSAHRLQAMETPDGRTLRFDHDAVGRQQAAWIEESATGRRSRRLLWRLTYADNTPLAEPVRIEQPSVAPGRLHRIDIRRDHLGRPISVHEQGWRPEPDAHSRVRWAPLARRFELGHRLAGNRAGDAAPFDWLSSLAWVDGPLPGSGDRIPIDQVGRLLRVRHPHGIEEQLMSDDGLLQEHLSMRGVPVRFDGADRTQAWLGGPTVISARAQARSLGLRYGAFGELEGLTLRDEEQHRTLLLDRSAWSQESARPTGASRNRPAPAARQALEHWRGRATALALPDGSIFRRGFDDFGRVAWIDEPGRPRQWARHDDMDRLIEHRPGDGSVLRYRRDAAGRLIESTRDAPLALAHNVAVRPHTGSPAPSIAQARRPGGRTTRSGSTVTLLGRYRWDGLKLIEAHNDTVTIRYEWDRLGRLVAAEHRFAEQPDEPLRHVWHYDLASRISAETLPGGLTVHYRHEGAEVVGLTVEGLPDAQVDALMLRAPLVLHELEAAEIDPAGARHEGGRLIEAAGVRHEPDPHGRRAAKRFGPFVAPGRGHGTGSEFTARSQTEQFVHQDWRLRTERRRDGTLKHWLWAGPRPVGLIEGGRLYRIVTDERAAPVRALDARGHIVWSADYNRAGAARVNRIDTGSKSITVPLRMPGQYADAETGWHANHWRMYSPRLGRYLESDPLGLQEDYTGRDSLTAYAGGDPTGSIDPWGLARLTWFALTQDAQGRSLGRTQGFDRARWSFMIEDILPTPLVGSGLYAPQIAGIEGVLFDPWGDFITGPDAPRSGLSNGVDAIAWNGTTGREVFASFAAHYGGVLASPQRFIVEGFDDRRAGALALILSASPSQRQACVARTIADLPALDLGPAEPLLTPGKADGLGPPRVLECQAKTALPVAYANELERSRVERYQAAAELQESPSAAIGEDCTVSTGCRTRARIDVNGRSYHASYGRTQFTVTTFLGELGRLTSPAQGQDGAALRTALKLDTPILMAGQAATLLDALTLARRRVEAAYRAFAALRTEFGRGLGAAAAAQIWEGLAPARRSAFTADTGLGQDGFSDMLGYVATQVGGRTEEEGRHALAASAAATVRYSGQDAPGVVQGFDQWLIALYSSRDPYDHVSRTFLRDNLRRIMAAPRLAGQFSNPEPAGTPAHRTRQAAIELDLAQRVAVLHNAGNLDLATRPGNGLTQWLSTHPGSWITGYVTQFVATDSRGNWESLRCASELGGRAGMQFNLLTAMPNRLGIGSGSSTLLPR